MSGTAHSSRAVITQQQLETSVAIFTTVGIAVHLVLRYGLETQPRYSLLPLYLVLLLGGIPLVWALGKKLLAREFGSDLLAGMSILTSVVLEEYLVGCIVVLMLSGGAALEQYATRRASSVLDALARRMPSVAHRRTDGTLADVLLEQIAIGDRLVVFPHEVCPVDGVVVDGHGVMDEAYLTGEPFEISKTPGSQVISGAVNGETALTIEAEKLPVDSRYARIMRVVEQTALSKPRIRRLGDQLGAWYTPAALAIAAVAWAATGDSLRFLAVLVVATPCPLLIAIPVAIIGGISLSARRGIIIKNPAVLEQIENCRTLIFDKTGTLTYGQPTLTEIVPAPGFSRDEVLRMAASLERYSKHPLGGAILRAASEAKLALESPSHISEPPGQGMRGKVGAREVFITGRKKVAADLPLPPEAGGLECIVFLDGAYAATFRFRDAPRSESKLFLKHLKPRHRVEKVILLSGDRESEVRYLASAVGIADAYYEKSPEEKVEIVQRETQSAPTLFVGDGVNDAPAMQAATVGVAFGQHSDVTAEAADAVVMESSLGRVDELMHIARRMRRIALQSAVGGMAVSILGMLAAAWGYLPPLAGAITQEIIDLVVVINALRAALPFRDLTDF